MRLSKISTLASVVALVALVAQPAFAEEGQQPNATFLIGGEIFAQGQSNNLGPAVNQILGDFWVDGACPDGSSWELCDDLRFGLSLFPHETCTWQDATSGGCTQYNNVLVEPQEDGGDPVEYWAQHGGGEFNSDFKFRPLDEALLEHQAHTFDGTDTAADSPWERPNLALLIIDDFPQTRNGQEDDRVKTSILNACRLLHGDDGAGSGNWPSMPTWAMVARRYEERSVPFAGLVSAAGGTGSCCYDVNGSCDPVADAIDDICGHVSVRDETTLRTEIESGMYVCGAGNGYVQTGQMDFDGDTGTKPDVACHMAGRYNQGQTCEDQGREGTNVLGIMSCVRQLPAGVDPDKATFYHCDDHGCTELPICDDDADEDCVGVEWVDPNRSLYVATRMGDDGKLECLEGPIEVTECPNEGDTCTVDTRLDGSPAHGRCSVGRIACDSNGEYCEQLYNPMPEICNGLDDDCDGTVDNLSDSWDDFSYDPTELGDHDDDGVDRTGIHCYEKNVCVCPGGPMEYGGPGYEGHVMSWQPGSCECGEGLEESTGGYTPAPAQTDEPQAGCSASGGAPVGLGWLALVVFGLVGVRRLP
jgi:uncharacterized protein (TIGR03382 family)